MLLVPLPIDLDAEPAPWLAAAPLPFPVPAGLPLLPSGCRSGTSRIDCVDGPDEDDEDLGDEEDLTVAQPTPEEESTFDDFDDEFDDDFEEEENDPDWDHPDDAAPEPPPPGKGPTRKK